MLRYENPRSNLVDILDNMWTIFAVVSDGNLKGYGLLYRLMEYHLDPELER